MATSHFSQGESYFLKVYATCHNSFISTLQVENFFIADKSDHIFHTRELKHLQVELVIL